MRQPTASTVLGLVLGLGLSPLHENTQAAPLRGGPRTAGWVLGGAALLEPVGQRAPGVQDMSLGDRPGPLGVVVTKRVEQLLVLVERMFLVVGEQGEEVGPRERLA